MTSLAFLRPRRFPSSSSLLVALLVTGARAASAEEEPIGTPPAEPSPEAAVSADAAAPEAATSADAPAEPPPVVDASSGESLFESSGSGAASASVGDLQFELGGYVRGDAFIGVLPDTSEPAINAAYGELSFQPKIKKGDWGSAFADLRVRYGQQLTEKDLFVDLREAYVNAYFGPVDVRVGKQIIVWGRALGINPTNNLSSVDFRIRSPVEDDKRIGNFATRINLNLNPVRIEGVWQPLYEPTMLPEFELDPAVSFVEPNYPAPSLRNGTFAGKVQLETSVFEGSLSYLNGNAPLPGLAYVNHKTVTPTDDSYWVQIQRASYRQHVVGLDFAAVVGELFGVRGEAAFRSPINPGGSVEWAAKPDVQYVLGLDREFGSVMVIAQYLGRYTLNWEPERAVDGDISWLGPPFRQGIAEYPTDPKAPGYNPSTREANIERINDTLYNNNRMLYNQLERVQHLASLRVEWKTMQEKLALSATGLVNFSTQEWALFPKVTYQITGGISTAIGGEVYMGPDGTLFGLISDRLTAGYAELRMTF